MISGDLLRKYSLTLLFALLQGFKTPDSHISVFSREI